MVKLRDVHGNNLLVNISISVQIASADVTLQGGRAEFQNIGRKQETRLEM
jgi:hypothetical protein